MTKFYLAKKSELLAASVDIIILQRNKLKFIYDLHPENIF